MALRPILWAQGPVLGWVQGPVLEWAQGPVGMVSGMRARLGLESSEVGSAKRGCLLPGF